MQEFTHGKVSNVICSRNIWKRYHVRIRDPDNDMLVYDQFMRGSFDNIKKELRELSNDYVWDGYHVDIREYRHVTEMMWRSKL